MIHWSRFDEVSDAIPSSLQPWLTHAESMTVRMKSFSTVYDIHVLDESWKTPRGDVQQALLLSPVDAVWFRKVEIHCDKKPVMLAESYFSKKFVESFNEPLKTLGEKPLGELIFSHPDLKRSEFEYGFDVHWARQSILRLENKPFLLREFFIRSDIYGHDYS